MLINNVHKCKNTQINCDPWTEGVYQGSYTLKEVCLAQNSYFLPEMELPRQNFHTKWQKKQPNGIYQIFLCDIL